MFLSRGKSRQMQDNSKTNITHIEGGKGSVEDCGELTLFVRHTLTKPMLNGGI